MHPKPLALLLLATLCLSPVCLAAQTPPTDGRTNLAAGKTVRFAPAPNYSLTKKGGTDATDLTDGKLTQRQDQEIWREKLAVGWRYGGRVNLALDLGQESQLDELAIRFVGGAGNGGINVPGWVQVMVSDDGEHYRKVAEYSQFIPGDIKKFGIPTSEGKAWIHCLRFKGLDTTARWVGLRFMGSGKSVSDELYVFGTPAQGGAASDDQAANNAEPAGTGFSVDHAQAIFTKPYLELATNLPLPQPIELNAPAKGRASGDGPLRVAFDLPRGVKLRATDPRPGIQITDKPVTPIDGGGHRYELAIKDPGFKKSALRLYLQASGWDDGQTGELVYRFGRGDWRSRDIAVPLRAVEVQPVTPPKRLMVGLGWWYTHATLDWPDVLDTWAALGMNTYPVHAYHIMDDSADSPSWRLLETARSGGWKIANIDSTLKRMERAHKNDKEIFCQFEDGSVSRHVCPSYRGRYYREEVQRFAKLMARVHPDFSSQDIEMWGWQGPEAQAKKCTRCRADYKRSGAESWDAWTAQKGDEIWSELTRAARRQLKQAGHKPSYDGGGYNFRPDHVYQNVFSFNHLYPKWMQHGEVSTYTNLYPGHLTFIGDEVRMDRAQVPGVMPWVTPGDAGTFTGDQFMWSLLEAYANGARGVWFWSNRLWDGENLIAMSRVTHAVGPVEDTIIDGQLIGDSIRVIGPGRVSGMRDDKRVVLLVADYSGQTDGRVRLALQTPGPVVIRDLLNDGEVVQRLAGGAGRVAIALDGEPARFLSIEKAK